MTGTLAEGSDSASTNVTLSTAPASGSTIQITLFDSDAGEQTFSQVNTQTIKADGSTSEFALSQTPAEFGPLHNTVIVERNGIRLSPPDTAYYSGDGTTYAFNVPTTINLASVPSRSDIEVYLNGERQVYNLDWYYNEFGITADQSDEFADATNVTADQTTNAGTGVVYFNTRPSEDDAIAIVVKVGHEYTIEDNNLVLTSLGSENDETRFVKFITIGALATNKETSGA